MEMGWAGCACLHVGEMPHTRIVSGPRKKKVKYQCCIVASSSAFWQVATQFLPLWLVFVITTDNNDYEKTQVRDISSTFKQLNETV